MTGQSANAPRRGSTGNKTSSTPKSVVLSAEVFGEPIYTVRQAADAMGVSVDTLYDWIKAGDVMALRFGGKEYRITQSALRQYKQDRETEAREAFDARRTERRLEAELAKLRAREPWAHWQLTFCPSCADRQVLTTRQERKAPRFWCEDCTIRLDAVGGYDRRNVAERAVRIQIDEYNAEAGVPESGWPVYLLYRCGVCERPQMVSADQARDPEFYPHCSHSWLDPAERPNDGMDLQGNQRPHPLVVRALAPLELEARAAEWCDAFDEASLDLSPYRLATCPACNRNPVVVSVHAPDGTIVICRVCLAEQRVTRFMETFVAGIRPDEF
jgi:excisionase family DNA binding protein